MFEAIVTLDRQGDFIVIKNAMGKTTAEATAEWLAAHAKFFTVVGNRYTIEKGRLLKFLDYCKKQSVRTLFSGSDDEATFRQYSGEF